MSMRQNSEADGRFRADNPDHLLLTQEPAVRTIVKGLARLTLENDKRRLGEQPDPTERPHQVFLIDGSRGAGKTYTLLTAELALRELSALCAPPSVVSEGWAKKLQTWLSPQQVKELQ